MQTLLLWLAICLFVFSWPTSSTPKDRKQAASPVNLKIVDAMGTDLNSFFDGITPNPGVAERLHLGFTTRSSCSSLENLFSGLISKIGIITSVSAQSCNCSGGECPCLGCNQIQSSNDCGLACDMGPDWSTYYDWQVQCSGGANNGMTNCNLPWCGGCAIFVCSNPSCGGC